ncbi:MAG: hypothetical protein K9H61_00875 [Bacteroidia bacterium]|nr:hypothetical protein [Bacteroidia bacterium]MCF8426171.1 hypothetical protein [Bacteroidia bacterium]MCF8445519.1 hypothetical protein [Bacteroidia bacterium]
MKTKFRNFKQADAWIQLIALGVVVFAFLVQLISEGQFKWSHDFFYFYYIIGSFQLASFFINWFLAGYKQSRERKIFAYFLLVFLIGLIPPLTFFGLFALLFLSPITAVFYVYLNFQEAKELAFFY